MFALFQFQHKSLLYEFRIGKMSLIPIDILSPSIFFLLFFSDPIKIKILFFQIKKEHRYSKSFHSFFFFNHLTTFSRKFFFFHSFSSLFPQLRWDMTQFFLNLNHLFQWSSVVLIIDHSWSECFLSLQQIFVHGDFWRVNSPSFVCIFSSVFTLDERFPRRWWRSKCISNGSMKRSKRICQ